LFYFDDIDDTRETKIVISWEYLHHRADTKLLRLQ